MSMQVLFSTGAGLSNASFLLTNTPITPIRTIGGDGFLKMYLYNVALQGCSLANVSWYPNYDGWDTAPGKFLRNFPDLCIYFDESNKLEIAAKHSDVQVCSHYILETTISDIRQILDAKLEVMRCEKAEFAIYDVYLSREQDPTKDVWFTKKADICTDQYRTDREEWKETHPSGQEISIDAVEYANEFELSLDTYDLMLEGTNGIKVVDINDGTYGRLALELRPDGHEWGARLSPILTWLPEDKGRWGELFRLSLSRQ